MEQEEAQGLSQPPGWNPHDLRPGPPSHISGRNEVPRTTDWPFLGGSHRNPRHQWTRGGGGGGSDLALEAHIKNSTPTIAGKEQCTNGHPPPPGHLQAARPNANTLHTPVSPLSLSQHKGPRSWKPGVILEPLKSHRGSPLLIFRDTFHSHPLFRPHPWHQPSRLPCPLPSPTGGRVTGRTPWPVAEETEGGRGEGGAGEGACHCRGAQ